MRLFNWTKENELPISEHDETELNLNYLSLVLNQWLYSDLRQEQLNGEDYYDGIQEIQNRKKEVIGEDGQLTTINNVECNKILDNQYRKLVDQKTNYTLGKPLTVSTGDDTYLDLLGQVFDAKMHQKLRILVQYAVNGGIAWLYPYYDEFGKFKIEVFPSHEICAVWKDKLHTELDLVMRYYSVEVFTEKGTVETVNHVDVYTLNGIYHCIHIGNKLVWDTNKHSSYMTIAEQGYNWVKIPMIPFKYNTKEIPLIRNVKALQDALNEVMSSFMDNMTETPRTSILKLLNYDGTNIGEFRKNLATYGVVKITTVDGVRGDVDTLKVEVDAANYKAILMQLKRAIIENGRGFDAKEERMDGDPNQMNIQSMYTDIDLDVNGMETEFQAGFEELKWFIDQYLIQTGKGDFTNEAVEFVFNRDIFINEDSMIDNCVKSVGVISNKTIVARHPWVTNLEHELKQIAEDKAAELEEMEQMTAFQTKQTGGDT